MRSWVTWPLIGFFATLPWGNIDVAAGVQVVHITALIAVAAGVWGVLWGADGADLSRLRQAHWALAAVAAFCVVQLGAALFSLNAARSAKATVAMWIGAALLVTVVLLGSREVIRTGLTVSVFSSVFVTLPVLLGTGALSARFGGSIVNGRPTGPFSDPNQLGSYAMIALILACGVLLIWEQSWMRVALAAAGVCAAGCMVLTLSRGAWLGAAVGLVCLAVLHRPVRRVLRWGAAAGMASVALLMVWSPSGALTVVQERVASLGDPGANPYDVRDITYNQALTEFAQRPVWGSGPATFPELSGGSGSFLQFYPRQHAHNGVLTLAVESGLLGVLSGAAVIGVLLWGVGRAVTRGQVSVKLATSVAALAALSGHLLVDYTLRNPVLLLLAWSLLALSLRNTGHSPPKAQERIPDYWQYSGERA